MSTWQKLIALFCKLVRTNFTEQFGITDPLIFSARRDNGWPILAMLKFPFTSENTIVDVN